MGTPLYVPPCPHFIREGIHTVCALLVWERSTHGQLSRELTARNLFVCQCGCSTLGEHSLRRALSPTFPAVWVPPLLRQSFSPSSPARSSAHSLGMEARSEKVSSTPKEGTALALSSSGASIDRDEAVDLPPQSVLFEELW